MQEYWDNFYSDDAPYFYDKALAEKGDTVHSWTSWTTPKFSKWLESDVISERDIEVGMDLGSNPLSSSATATKSFLLLSKTDTKIEIAVNVS